MIWKVKCRVCPGEFPLDVMDRSSTRVPAHRISAEPDAGLCRGSNHFGYPMYARRGAFGRTWWGW